MTAIKGNAYTTFGIPRMPQVGDLYRSPFNVWEVDAVDGRSVTVRRVGVLRDGHFEPITPRPDHDETYVWIPELFASMTRVCSYCGAADADGFVPAYLAHVCRPCYVDHHGDPDALFIG